MNQSIYTESAPLLARKDLVEWLDGCGAVWGSGAVFSKSEALVYPYVCFGGPPVKYFQAGSSYHLFEGKYTHIPTGTEFCERVAEILGVEKPVFEQFGNSEQVDISKKETTTDHIPYVGQKVDEQDKLFPGRNNTMGEGSLTQEDIEILLGDSIVKPIKGMAIEVSRLSESDKESLSMLQYSFQASIKQAIKNNLCVGFWSFGSSGFSDKNFYKSAGFTITESPTEFREYVAQQTGKEYKKEWGQTHGNPRTSQPVSESYKFKTYRILDSLDGIPMDTRIPLSEWIPPMGVEVCFIEYGNEYWHKGFVVSVAKTFAVIEVGVKRMDVLLDGHWMRIV